MRNVIKTEMMDIKLRIIGIKKRQKTVKVHNIDVSKDLPYNNVDLNEYKQQALDVIRNTMRTVEKCELYLAPWTRVDEEGYEHSMKEVRFGDTRYKCIMIEEAWRYTKS